MPCANVIIKLRWLSRRLAAGSPRLNPHLCQDEVVDFSDKVYSIHLYVVQSMGLYLHP